MDNKRQDILEKIAKLLALADGTNNEAESEAARKRVSALLAAYNLELGMLRNKQEIVLKTINLNRGNADRLMSNLHGEIAEFSGCTLLIEHTYTLQEKAQCQYIIIGRNVDIVATEYMMDVVNRQIGELYAAYKKTCHGRKRHSSYKAGLIRGVIRELNRITSEVLRYQQQEEGLVLVNEMKVRSQEAMSWYKKDHIVGNGRGYSGEISTEGYRDGIADASKVQLRAPVSSENTEILGITAK